jgi:hypothetical protein
MKIIKWTFSEKFSNYVTEISKEIPLERVYWGYTNEAPPSLWKSNGLHTYNPETETIIVLLNSNLETDFAELVAAHELAHEVLNRNGYPICMGSRPETVDVVTHINSSLTDPAVNDFIESFGYDTRPLHGPAVQFALEDWTNMPPGRSEVFNLDLIYNAIVIHNRYFEMSPEEWTTFELLCKEKTPKTYELAIKLINIHEKNGHSAPEAVINNAIQWREAFNTTGLKIITRNGTVI